jgi:hypothetical protein
VYLSAPGGGLPIALQVLQGRGRGGGRAWPDSEGDDVGEGPGGGRAWPDSEGDDVGEAVRKTVGDDVGDPAGEAVGDDLGRRWVTI